MPVIISDVAKGSPADKKRIKPGDTLVSINGHDIADVLDYSFYADDSELRVVTKRESGAFQIVRVEKEQGKDLGLIFETYLMDKKRSCKNKCMFCFIDQLPKGLRESLYFKDDDARLSFLFGNYITLTNLTEREVQRIMEMHISPVNISVHTMNPELRVKMMANPNAGEALKIVKRLADAGISINTQLVLCPGVNDGEELKYSLKELAALYPSVQSIAAVPVGITKFREGLCHIEPYTKEQAAETVDIIEQFGNEFKKDHGTRLAFAADEFYLKAGRPIPDGEYYEEFAQLENGVGLWADLRDSFAKALSETEECPNAKERKISMATGTSAYPLINSLAQKAQEKFKNLHIEVTPIKNKFFGETINVAGLLTGTDLIDQLNGKDLGEELLIPSVMLRSEGDIFLDDLSPEDLEEKLKVKVTPVDNDGYALLSAMIGE